MCLTYSILSFLLFKLLTHRNDFSQKHIYIYIYISLLQNVRPVLEPIQPPVQWASGFFLGVTRLGREGDHLPPPRVEVKECSYTATSPVCLQDVDRENSALFYRTKLWSSPHTLQCSPLFFKSSIKK